MDKARAILRNVTYVDKMDDVAEGCDALVIATEVAGIQSSIWNACGSR